MGSEGIVSKHRGRPIVRSGGTPTPAVRGVPLDAMVADVSQGEEPRASGLQQGGRPAHDYLALTWAWPVQQPLAKHSKCREYQVYKSVS
jgi:hypothetical protein